MCKLKSAIILKDRVFIPDYDSHSEMLAELGIDDTRANAETLFVRAELSPRNGDAFAPIDEWVFHIDQDIRPEWFVENYEKERMIAAVKEWAETHIHVGDDGLKIDAGCNHYVKDCKNVEISGSASVERISGSASVEYIGGSASVKYIGGSASVERIGDSASVEYIGGSAVVSGSIYGWKNKDEFALSDNATFRDFESKIIYQAGEWEFRLVPEKEATS